MELLCCFVQKIVNYQKVVIRSKLKAKISYIFLKRRNFHISSSCEQLRCILYNAVVRAIEETEHSLYSV